jgi:two-component system phosphate regulon sensor histidine kinase PhoR
MTSGNSIFRKLLFSAFLLIAVSLLIMDFYLTRYMADLQRDAVKQQLTVEAKILAAGIPAHDLANWAVQAQVLTEARITIIDPAGTVLADSQHDPETMENHAGRPEIIQARQGRVGFSISRSATLNRDLCYLA